MGATDELDSRGLYRLLVENSLGLMCIHDLEGVLLSVNPAVSESLGYEPGYGPGRSLRDFLVPAVRPLFDEYLRRIQRNRKDSGLMRVLAKDSSERIWMYRNTLYEREGSAPLVLGHALDVTEQVHAERALKDAQAALRAANDQLAARVEERTAELREANERLRAEIAQRAEMEEELLRARKLESLGVLAGGIAHDFNNFLTVVQGNIELVRILLVSGDPVEDVLDETMRACQRAAFLASQLLTFSKGGVPIRRVADVGALIRDAVSLARAGASISVSLDIDDHLWFAEVDTGQIAQVLHNVLLNARQAMPEGGLIDVCAQNVLLAAHQAPTPGRYVRISVRDYGCGIAPEILPRIFDPYFTTKRAGSGLGLATAYAIVSKHSGHIAVESKPGAGTTFTIDLPATDRQPEALPAADTSMRGGTGKLLVMDDEPALRTLLDRVLTTAGYSVECARDGAEAIAIYEAAKAFGPGFDAVLLDLTVSGGMGGIETAARLREVDPTVKLIVSSGYSDAPVMAEFRKYGFDDMLPKPWTPAQLTEVFQRVLASDRDREPRR